MAEESSAKFGGERDRKIGRETAPAARFLGPKKETPAACYAHGWRESNRGGFHAVAGSSSERPARMIWSAARKIFWALFSGIASVSGPLPRLSQCWI